MKTNLNFIISIILVSAFTIGCQSGGATTDVSRDAALSPTMVSASQLISYARKARLDIMPVVTSGLSRVANMASPHDGTNRLFIIEQNGRIRIVSDFDLVPEPFLDISSIIMANGFEQGLLDLAFHPEYVSNGLFYVNYTRFGDGWSVVAEYKVSAGDPDVANPSSERILMTVEQPALNHNGGKLNFGPDGYLYIALGDGGGGGDTFGNGQNLDTLLGSILRIDVNPDGPNPYTIPAGNPFIGKVGRDEIWAYGLRNPWQFSFDSQTGDMYIADVGQASWEEVNFQPVSSSGGENYGWPLMEGAHCYPNAGCDPFGVLPVSEYDHFYGCSITGIGVYRGNDYPMLNGVYFYGDYCTGRIWGMKQNRFGVWRSQMALNTTLNITGAGEDEQGNIYFAEEDGLYMLVQG